MHVCINHVFIMVGLLANNAQCTNLVAFYKTGFVKVRRSCASVVRILKYALHAINGRTISESPIRIIVQVVKETRSWIMCFVRNLKTTSTFPALYRHVCLSMSSLFTVLYPLTVSFARGMSAASSNFEKPKIPNSVTILRLRNR